MVGTLFSTRNLLSLRENIFEIADERYLVQLKKVFREPHLEVLSILLEQINRKHRWWSLDAVFEICVQTPSIEISSRRKLWQVLRQLKNANLIEFETYNGIPGLSYTVEKEASVEEMMDELFDEESHEEDEASPFVFLRRTIVKIKYTAITIRLGNKGMPGYLDFPIGLNFVDYQEFAKDMAKLFLILARKNMYSTMWLLDSGDYISFASLRRQGAEEKKKTIDIGHLNLLSERDLLQIVDDDQIYTLLTKGIDRDTRAYLFKKNVRSINLKFNLITPFKSFYDLLIYHPDYKEKSGLSAIQMTDVKTLGVVYHTGKTIELNEDDDEDIDW